MNKAAAFLAIFTLAAGSVQAASTPLWNDDFTAHYGVGGGNSYFPASQWNSPTTYHPGMGDLSTNAAYEGFWFANANSGETGNSLQYAVMIAADGAVNPNNGADFSPPLGNSGAGLRTGYNGHTDVWRSRVDVNTGLTLDANTNYIISVRARMKYSPDHTTNLVGSGSIEVAAGYWDDTVASNNFQWFNTGRNFSNLTSTAWVTNSIEVYGAVGNAAGQKLVLRLVDRSPMNSPNFETWIDRARVDAYNPWTDYADDEGLATYERTDDDDEDGVDNFTEWAVGGDPLDPGDTGYSAYLTFHDMNADGTNEVLQIFPRIANHWATGIQYTFETADGLTGGAWVPQVTWDAEPGDDLWSWQPSEIDGFGPGYDAVTNIYRNAILVSNDMHFIKLNIGHPSYNP